MHFVRKQAYILGYMDKSASFAVNHPTLTSALYALAGAGAGGTAGSLLVRSDIKDQLSGLIDSAKKQADKDIDQQFSLNAQTGLLKQPVKDFAHKALDNQGKNANKELVGPATFYGGVTGAVGGSVAGLLIAEMHKALARSREEKDIE